MPHSEDPPSERRSDSKEESRSRGARPTAISAWQASELEESLARLERYAAESRAENTLRAYAADLEDFRHWCERYGRSWLPAQAETVGLYLGARAEEMALASLERRLAAINSLHKDEGYDPPASVAEGPLRRIWRGLVREKTRRQEKAEPLLAEDLRQMVAHLPRYAEPFQKRRFRAAAGELTLTALRDRALLLVDWAGALRRSELVALETSDVELVPGEGFTIYVRRSKQELAGEGLFIGLPYGARSETCPVLALRT